ncbi:hypothetical protein E3O44_17135 [Cryobacterium algoricola]|uniref:Uncharacterized protein n=1 Tax=Cryobacterium algoricola TaxID=1259183 RepID=A0ABY2I7C9_9MICO|nr:hypothetical protein [Cryobacterium algoricola]TFB83599.1 hypothetical protein E3O44_17135 [Cryobacterium algoricola]
MTANNSNAIVPVWTLATEEVSLPNLFGEGNLTPARLAELRTVLASLAVSPIATLEVHTKADRRARSGGIRLHAASPLANQLSQLVSQTVKSGATAKSVSPALDAAAAGDVLYRMVVPAKVAAQFGQGLVKPMIAKGVPGGIYGGLRDAASIVGNAAFVPVAGKAATAGAGAAAAGAGGAVGAAGAAGGAVATAGVITVAAPLVLMAVAVGVSAYAEHERQQAIERITDLLQQLHDNDLEKERSELDGCRDAIDKATAVLLDQGRIGPALGLDSAVHAISKSLELTRRRLSKWQASLASLPEGPVELTALTKEFPGIHEEGGIFRAHLELARLTIALKRRVLVLQAVEQAQMDGGSNPFANFVSALQEDERRVNELESALSSILLHLSTLELRRHTGLFHPVSTPGEVDALLRAVYRLRNFANDLSVGGTHADVAIEIERSNDGSLVVFPAEAV